MKTYACYGGLVLLLLVAAPWTKAEPASAPAKDPFIGNWMMNPDKSTFMPGPVPEDRTMIIERKNGGWHHLTRTRNEFLGNTNDIDYTAKFDGKDYPITGTGLDTVALKRIDTDTIERTGKVHGKPSETCTMKVSPDGKVLTLTVKGSYSGTNYSSVQVYERQ